MIDTRRMPLGPDGCVGSRARHGPPTQFLAGLAVRAAPQRARGGRRWLAREGRDRAGDVGVHSREQARQCGGSEPLLDPCAAAARVSKHTSHASSARESEPLPQLVLHSAVTFLAVAPIQ